MAFSALFAYIEEQVFYKKESVAQSPGISRISLPLGTMCGFSRIQGFRAETSRSKRAGQITC